MLNIYPYNKDMSKLISKIMFLYLLKKNHLNSILVMQNCNYHFVFQYIYSHINNKIIVVSD